MIARDQNSSEKGSLERSKWQMNDGGLGFYLGENKEMGTKTRISQISPILVEFQILNFTNNWNAENSPNSNLSLVIKERPPAPRVMLSNISAYFITLACTCIDFVPLLLHFEINSPSYANTRLQAWEVTSSSLSCIYLRWASSFALFLHFAVYFKFQFLNLQHSSH